MSEIRLTKLPGDKVSFSLLRNDRVILSDTMNSESACLDYLSSICAAVSEGFRNVTKEGF